MENKFTENSRVYAYQLSNAISCESGYHFHPELIMRYAITRVGAATKATPPRICRLLECSYLDHEMRRLMTRDLIAEMKEGETIDPFDA